MFLMIKKGTEFSLTINFKTSVWKIRLLLSGLILSREAISASGDWIFLYQAHWARTLREHLPSSVFNQIPVLKTLKQVFPPTCMLFTLSWLHRFFVFNHLGLLTHNKKKHPSIKQTSCLRWTYKQLYTNKQISRERKVAFLKCFNISGTM